MKIPDDQKRPKMTDGLRGSLGAFTSVGSNQLHYISTSLDIAELNVLKTARQVLPKGELTIRELMQRDIDDERVRDDILPYLRPGQAGLDAKLFPPLLVAVICKDDDSLSPLYPKPLFDQSWKENRYFSEEEEAWFEDRYYGNSFAVRIPLPSEDSDALDEAVAYASEFKWHRERVELLVLDGQHRLMALKAAFGKLDSEERVRGYRGAELQQEEKDRLGMKSVPICIVFPPELYRDSELLEEGDSVIRVFRQIFVDVNRSAKRVSESRNILLNERDLIAEFTRTVMDDFLNEYDLNEDAVCNDDEIPLYCFEWDSPEKREFQISDPRAISSVGVLNNCIDRLLLRGKDDYGHFRGELSIEEGIVAVDPESAGRSGVSPNRITPLRFENWQQDYIRGQFESRWKEAIMVIIRDLFPSRAITSELEGKRLELTEQKDDEEDKLATHSLEYLLGSRSDREQIRRVSKLSEDWVGRFQPSACKKAVEAMDAFHSDTEARLKNGPFSRLFFSNLGQTEIFEVVYQIILGNVDNVPDKPVDLGRAFVSDFNEAFRSRASCLELFKSDKDWNLHAIDKLGKQSWKQDHMKGLLLITPCFFGSEPSMLEFFDSPDSWKETVTDFYKLSAVNDDAYIRKSLSSRLPNKLKNEDNIRVITDRSKRIKELNRKVSEETDRIIGEMHDFVLSAGDPPETVQEQFTRG